MTAIGRLSLICLDCPDPKLLAAFYASVTGLRIRADDPTSHDEVADDGDSEWVELDNGGGVTVAFQRVDGYVPPVWPGNTHPQQAHLDIDVIDLDVAEAAVLAIGATKSAYQPGITFRVFLDPVGHPFCLVLDPAMR